MRVYSVLKVDYTPFLKWGGIALAVILVLALGAYLLWRQLNRRSHDRELEAELQAEVAQVAPSALSAEIKVIPEAELPRERGGIFMPVPATMSDMVDFVSEAKDGIDIRSCIRAEDADRLISNAQASNLRFTVFRDNVEKGDLFEISLDVLSAHFAAYSYVNLAILKEHGLAPATAVGLSVRAEGVLRKPLFIEANAISSAGVKMISAVGGRAVVVEGAVRALTR